MTEELTPEEVELRESAREALKDLQPPDPDDRDLPEDIPTGHPDE